MGLPYKLRLQPHRADPVDLAVDVESPSTGRMFLTLVLTFTTADEPLTFRFMMTVTLSPSCSVADGIANVRTSSAGGHGFRPLVRALRADDISPSS